MGTRRRASTSARTHEAELAELEGAFASFRRGRTRQGRIPQGLRERVLAAVEAGVPAAALGRRCGVTMTQLAQWRSGGSSSGGEATRSRRPAEASPAILRVVHEPVVRAPNDDDATIEVALGVGSWRVSIFVQPAGRRTRPEER